MDKELDSVLARLCVFREAGGESVIAKAGVYRVILNRMNDPWNRWPKSIHQVVTEPYQFSSFNANDSNVTRWPDEKLSVGWNAWLDCGIAAENAMLSNPVDGSQFYHDVSIAPPAEQWLGKGKTVEDLLKFKTVQIGRLVFYSIPG